MVSRTLPLILMGSIKPIEPMLRAYLCIAWASFRFLVSMPKWIAQTRRNYSLQSVHGLVVIKNVYLPTLSFRIKWSLKVLIYAPFRPTNWVFWGLSNYISWVWLPMESGVLGPLQFLYISGIKASLVLLHKRLYSRQSIQE